MMRRLYEPESPEQSEQLEKAAETIANLVEDEAWDHLSVEDSEKALEVLRDLIHNF
jgi:hypothetical protein